MSPTPAVSVVIPAYQVAPFIAETLESVRQQSFADWEALIIDDGSTDEIDAAVQPFLEDSRFRFHRFTNGGLAEARNRGIGLARGDFIAFLDGDDIYESSYLEQMTKVLETRAEVGFVSCDMMMFGNPASEGKRFSEIEPQVFPITVARVLERQFTIAGGTCMVRSEVLRLAGGFDATLRAAEDFELWVRLLMNGVVADYVDLPLVRYRRRPGSLSNSPVTFRTNAVLAYAQLMTRLAGRPEAEICRHAILAQLAALDRWEGEDALRGRRYAEAKKKLSRAAAYQNGWKFRVFLALAVVAPPAARWLRQLKDSL